ncbi:hypothetical protein F01_460099 [Burkholderia cenocepacia]|nr:hypothetical protein F01_460099 [Burkholderia cenocepacia]
MSRSDAFSNHRDTGGRGDRAGRLRRGAGPSGVLPARAGRRILSAPAHARVAGCEDRHAARTGCR